MFQNISSRQRLDKLQKSTTLRAVKKEKRMEYNMNTEEAIRKEINSVTCKQLMLRYLMGKYHGQGVNVEKSSINIVSMFFPCQSVL